MPDTNVNPHEATRPGPGQNPPAVSTNPSSGSGFDHREAVRVQEAERRRAEREAARREEERQREELREEEAGAGQNPPAFSTNSSYSSGSGFDHREAVRVQEAERRRAEREAREAAQREEERQREELREEEAGAGQNPPAVSTNSSSGFDHREAVRVQEAERRRAEREAARREEERQREELREEEAGARREAVEAGIRQARADALAQAARERDARIAAEKRREEEEEEAALLDEQTRQAERRRQGHTSLVPGFVSGAVVEDPSTGQPEPVQRAVIEDPSTGQPVPVQRPFIENPLVPRPSSVAVAPLAQRPGDVQPLRDTVRDDELQPISEGGKMAANLLATQGGGAPHTDGLGILSREDDFRQDISKDEALWRREGDVLTAAFALDSAGRQRKAAEKRLDKVQREIEVFSALDKPFSNLDPDSAIAKEGARRHQQSIDQLQQELEAAQADYDSAQTALSKLKEATEAAGVQITPAHWQYVEDRKPEPESFAFFFPLGTRSINLFNDARRPDSDGGIDVTKEEAKAISLAQIGDVVARSGSASTFIGGPGLVFNAGKGIIRGGALSKPLMGRILKEAPPEALEELGFQGSDILFYKEQFDLPGFAGEVAVESFLQGAGTFAPGRRTAGGTDAGTSSGPPVMTADQLTALLSTTDTGKETLAAIKQGSSTGPVMFTEDASG